jgi:Fe-S cluster biogenesis protein NfuA
MAEALLSVAGIAQVHFFENVLTVTQDGSMDWPKVDHTVQTIVQQLVDTHDSEFRASMDKTAEERRAHMSPELIRIDEILDRTIRPGLQADGGDVEPLDYDGMVLTIRYMGACGGCPSSMAGTLEAIKGILQDEFRPDLEVVAI